MDKSSGTKRFSRPAWVTLGLGLAALALLAAVAHQAWQVRQATVFSRETLLPGLRAASFTLRLEDLSPWQLQALLAVEDPGFYRHHGLDLSTPGAGITTITQGLVKLLYFDKFQPGLAKLRQSLIAALVLDPLASKDEQLLWFINLAPLGGQTRGMAAAAIQYFNKPFSRLDADEYLALVAALIAPETFHPLRHPARSQERVRRIKLLLGGQYQPKGLMDLFYGKLDQETRQNLPPLSYFEHYYD